MTVVLNSPTTCPGLTVDVITSVMC